MQLTPEEAWKIKDPAGVWYGPHECNGCGATVVKLSIAQGGITLDAPFNHHYPNHNWEKHVCKEIPLAEIKAARSQGVFLEPIKEQKFSRQVIDGLNEKIKADSDLEIRWVGYPGHPYVADKDEPIFIC